MSANALKTWRHLSIWQLEVSLIQIFDRPLRISKPGDLYLAGDHRLICGDCTDPSVVARFLAGARSGRGPCSLA
jgi:hypothetical protein